MRSDVFPNDDMRTCEKHALCVENGMNTKRCFPNDDMLCITCAKHALCVENLVNAKRCFLID